MKKIIGITAVVAALATASCGNSTDKNRAGTDSTMNATTDSSYQNSNVSPANPNTIAPDTMITSDSVMHRDSTMHKN